MSMFLTGHALALFTLLAGTAIGLIGAATGDVARRLLPQRFQRRGRWITVGCYVATTLVVYLIAARPWDTNPGLLWTAALMALALPAFVASVLRAGRLVRILMIPAGGVVAAATLLVVIP